MNSREAIHEAEARGYRIDDSGNLINGSGRALKPSRNRGGYLHFRFMKNGPCVRIHRLAAFQKFGDAIFEPGIQVRHLDGNPANNRTENIAIGTAGENAGDKLPEVRMAAAVKASHAVTRFDHDVIVGFLREGNTYAQAMSAFGIRSKGTISFIARRSIASKQEAA